MCSREESIKSIGSTNTYYLYHSNTIFNKCRSISSCELQMLKVLKICSTLLLTPPALKLGYAVCLRSTKLLDIFSHLNCKKIVFKPHFYCLSETKEIIMRMSKWYCYNNIMTHIY